MSMEPLAEAPAKPSFWQEAKPELIPALKAESKALAAIAAAFAVLYMVFYLGFDTDVLKTGKPDIFKEHPELVFKGIAGFLVWGSIYAVAIYTSCVLYLRRVVKTAPPQISIGHFFYWLGQCIKKYLALVLPFFGASILLVVLGIMMKGPGLAAAGVLIAVAFCYYMYASFRLYVVTPIALLGRPPVIKNSWNLTKGYCWRIFTGIFVLMLILMLVFLVPALVVNFVVSFTDKSIFAIVLSSILHGAYYSVSTMCSAVYVCTVYRVLLRERRASKT